MTGKTALKPLAVAALFSALITAGCGVNAQEKNTPSTKAEEDKAVRVQVMTVEPATFQQKIKLVGSAKAEKEVVIASEVPGRVVKLGFEKGDTVKAGQPLVWLDDSRLKAELSAAQAERGMARLDYDKLSALAERKASVSEFQLEQAKLKLDAAEARISSILASLEKLMITAPFSGTLVSKSVEQGAIVAPGQPLSRLINIVPIKLSTGVPETAISDFGVGKKAVVVFDAYPSKKYTGKVTYIAPEVDLRARTFECELELPNEDMKIMPEMSAKVTFIRKELPGSILIPQESIVELADGHVVFIVENGEFARQRRVTIEDMAEEMALIGEGLEAGEQLVTLGQRGLIDGDRIKIAE